LHDQGAANSDAGRYGHNPLPESRVAGESFLIPHLPVACPNAYASWPGRESEEPQDLGGSRSSFGATAIIPLR
jgi:hypothetical protein